MRRNLTFSLCLLVAASGGAAQAADPFLSPPGVAERGAAGAAVAGRGSLASTWHNPATLVDADTRLELEWQAAPDRQEDGGLDTGSNSWLLGTAFVNRNKWYGAAAIGIAAYTPHTMKYWVERSGKEDSAFGRVNLTTQVIGVPYAVEFDEIGLSLGVVGELIALDPSGSDLRTEDADGAVSEIEFDDAQQVGYSGALGFRYHVYDEGAWRADLGGVGRLPATAGASLGLESNEAELLLPDKPGGYELGLRVAHDLGDNSSVAGKLQYGSTDWGDSGKVRRHALGLSLRTPFGETAIFEPGYRVFRLGYARARAKEEESWMDWPDARVFSAGVAFVFDTGTHVDFTVERRSETRDEFDDQSGWFGGFALGLAY